MLSGVQHCEAKRIQRSVEKPRVRYDQHRRCAENAMGTAGSRDRGVDQSNQDLRYRFPPWGTQAMRHRLYRESIELRNPLQQSRPIGANPTPHLRRRRGSHKPDLIAGQGRDGSSDGGGGRRAGGG
ncbi:hypothetical protein U1Q18_049448 [Sarracenia purpurea var. burkii]